MKTIPHSMRSVAKLLRVIPLVLIFVCMVAAQPQSQYDHGTPPQHVSGISDIGSYLSTELGSVNLSNGALNMKIPVGRTAMFPASATQMTVGYLLRQKFQDRWRNKRGQA